MRKAREQTSDPLKNHTGNSKNGDGSGFDKQEILSTARRVRSSLKHDGGNGRCRVISPGSVKGFNP